MLSEQTNIPVCILAGGQSRRFGEAKGLASLSGERLIDIVARRLKAQTSGPLVLNCDPDGPYAELGLPIRPDVLPGDLGPLAGLHAAMTWAQDRGFGKIATCTIDVPFLPADLVSALEKAGAPCISASRAQKHPLIGIWPSVLAEPLADFLSARPRSAHAWAKHCNAQTLEFTSPAHGPDPFFNINTKEELKEARTQVGPSGQT